ncbi:MAG: hypothetical protein COA32_03290 [Fluviicola sp.]|nr:MAG: hypothetical protein COA32_03290 [Fluviicola sp.]
MNFGYTQDIFTYKIDISPKEQPKEILSQITENINFISRKIDNNSFLIIESHENHDEQYFEDIVSSLGENLTFFEKSEADGNKGSENYITKACCNLTLEMFDSWGDGWNGGFLTVTIDGSATNYSASGTGTTVNIAYCDGQTLELDYTSGSFEGENTYTISNPSATLFSDGPSPQTGLVYTSTTACSGPTPTPQDCEGAQMVCSNSSFSGNSSGSGNYNDLNASNEGCLDGENQSSWYYIFVGSNGTLEMSINPVAADDYDFAVWGDYNASTANANCPPIQNPVRCSWAAGTGATGLGNGASDNSEGAFGNSWVAPLNVQSGEVYILVIDNYSGSNNPFDLNWGGTASLDCTTIPLPVDLVSFTGNKKNNLNQLYWTTASETNNDYFILEYSSDGETWNEIEKISGAGSSNVENTYFTTHRDFANGINYYRLKQVDFDGAINTHNIISIDNSQNRKLLKRINAMGQEVDEDYKGIVFEYYNDGHVKQVYQN